MNVDELVDYFRAQIQDEKTDASNTDTYTIFKDAEVLQFVYEAQNELCIRSAMISDTKTNGVCVIPFVADQEFIDFHPSITNIRRARTIVVPRTLVLRDMFDMEQSVSNDYGLSGFHKGWEEAKGQPKYLVLDYEIGKIRLAPIPSTGDTVKLVVHRLPLCDVRHGADLEIPEQHRAQLVLWMQHLAYRKADSEVFDEALSDAYEQRFLAYAREADTRNKIRGKQQHAVDYGGY